MLFESVAPGGQRRAGRAFQARIRFLDHLEGVGVKAEPDVQTVLLDALAHLRIAPAGALAAQAPAQLVDGDGVPVLPARLPRQVIGRRHGRHAAAEDGDLFRRDAGIVDQFLARHGREIEVHMERQYRRLRPQLQAQGLVQREAVEGVQGAFILVAEQARAVQAVDFGRRGHQGLVHGFHASAVGELLEEDLVDAGLAQQRQDVGPAGLVHVEEIGDGQENLEGLLDEF